MSVMVLPSSFELSSASTLIRMEGFNCWPPAGQYETPQGDGPCPIAVNNEVPALEEEAEAEEEDDDRPGQFDVWNAIQSQKANSPPGAAPAAAPAPYVHPLMRRSSSMLSQKSLEICTESLGSETGSDDFSSFCDGLDYCYKPFNAETEPVEVHQGHEYVHQVQQQQQMLLRDEVPTLRTCVAEEDKPSGDDQVQRRNKGRQLTSVNYHCSISRKTPSRSFPPPLPSISRRDGPCIQMRPHRRDGRLVVEAVPVPSQNYLHAQREGGRLLLSFIDASFDESESTAKCSSVPAEAPQATEQEKQDIEEKSQEAVDADGAQTMMQYLAAEGQDDEEELLEEEEEEVEVVDRGTVVEVKVSSQTQQQSNAGKVVRSSLVINKFVGGVPLSGADASAEECEPPAEKNESKATHAYAAAPPAARRAVPTTTTTPAAAAVVAASTVSTISTDGYNACYSAYGGAPRPQPLDGVLHAPLDNKLLFTSKRRNREQLLHNMRRCSQLRRPLFIWEPCCIATTS